MLAAQDISVDLGDRRVLDAVSIEAEPGYVTALLGPSGCGKTTLLRAIAGLAPIASGRVSVNGADVTDVPAHRRGVALVFQDHALFPHRDVGENVGFGLRMRGVPEEQRRERVAEALDLVGLPGSERRPVQELSGGERQRVALARALAPEPDVLMLDEPLRSLDRVLRDRLLDELASIVRGLSCTVVYVTHDTGEAFRIADRVAIMRAGRMVQSGGIRDVWRHPSDEETARLLGHANIVDGRIADGRLLLGWADLAAPRVGDGPARVLIRSDALGLHGTNATGLVRSSRFEGDRVAVSVEVAPGVLLTVGCLPSSAPSVGESLGLDIDPDGVIALDP